MKDIRKLILRGVLGALAVAAAAGVLAALTRNDLVERLTGTGLTTAVAALLLLPLSAMVDRPKARAAGMAGVVAVAIEFILALALIWEIWRALGVRRAEEEILITGGVVLLTGVAAMVFLVLWPRPQTKVAGLTGLGATVGFLGPALAATWLTGPSWSTRDDLWVTAWSIGAFGLLAAVALVGVGHDRRHWRWAGVTASVPAAALVIVDAWSPTHRGPELFSLLCATSILAAWANLVVRAPLPPGQRWLRIGTLLAGGATALLSELIIFHLEFDLIDRVAVATTILAGCGTLALAVLAALRRRIDPVSMPREFQEITVICPACTKKQVLPLGGGTCQVCGLRIEVRVDVPRCSNCEYVLYRLSSRVCPECGTPVTFGSDAL